MVEKDTRYIRQEQIRGFGREGQQRLAKASVLVVGAGGLGVPVIQYLTAMGIGSLGIADGDRVEITNLHRQVIYQPNQVGQLKVEVCKQWVKAQNPSIIVRTFAEFLTVSNALSVIESYDLIIDATDNFEARYLINDACVIAGKPFVYGALQGFEGHVSVFNFQSGPTYRCLYPTPPNAGQLPDCNQAGVLGIVPGIIGSFQALEAVKVITGFGQSLSGSLLVIDLQDHSNYKLKIKENPANRQLKELQDSYGLQSCQLEGEISPDLLASWILSEKEFVLIDVREVHEFQHEHLEKAANWPLSKIDSSSMPYDLEKPWVLMCQVGSRSKKALDILKRRFPNLEIRHLHGGLAEWRHEMGDLYVAE
ncbi:Sulfur carrier protein adenylyltransferase ThiF [Lunatimonas lonarensis]|uniref:Molybdopterin-synthase adenylyltransferase n=1 Tax=Lunatimonas lonarensis TaxID=1232681 RepID=R7ZVX0_9BACT|nr:HesA/MoeB/ThiF family protein [Lunatimonas lonarensis]EON78158.1 Sulfur carrier protein adenylyltransferase ThiF [Lunatimonas lonarensis]